MSVSGSNDPTGFRILIVDDNPTSLDVSIEILQHDYRLNIVKSGKKALELIRKNIPDLILLDIVMPQMDGYEVRKHLKSVTKTGLIPVIFISSSNDPEKFRKDSRSVVPMIC